ncbi:MAG TPA: hypothetical protein VK618_11420, partial [Flavitalea sp.]|nr:hypothetical protein [Flavitalea sp.]
FYAFIKEKFMRHLDHDAGSVAAIHLVATGTAMLHIFQYGECIAYNLIGLIPFDIRDETYAAGIMFKCW